jgi:hypothetical protein
MAEDVVEFGQRGTRARGRRGSTRRLSSARGRLLSLDAGDRYVVLVAEPDSGEIDAHGPFDGITATTLADRLRAELDSYDFPEVQVTVARLRRALP